MKNVIGGHSARSAGHRARSAVFWFLAELPALLSFAYIGGLIRQYTEFFGPDRPKHLIICLTPSTSVIPQNPIKIFSSHNYNETKDFLLL